MPGFIDSIMRFGWAIALFGARQVRTMIGGSSPPSASSGPDRSAPPRADRPPPRVVRCGSLDTSTFVVLGDGLAAGMGDFTLSADGQTRSFPAHLAAQM